MRKKFVILGAFLLLLANSLVLAMVLEVAIEKYSGFAPTAAALVVTLLEPAVATVGLCLVIVQLNQENQGDERGRIVEQQHFLLEYNKAFIENEAMTNVEASLERYDQGLISDEDLITDENRQAFVNYLVYLEGFAPLVLDGIMDFRVLDSLMAYRFYLAVNNPVVQRDQLFRWPEYYLGCFRLYRKWTDFRHEKNLDILREDTSPLDGWGEYNKWLSIAEEAYSGER